MNFLILRLLVGRETKGGGYDALQLHTADNGLAN